MDTLQAVRQMLDSSGMTPYRASLLLGRDSTYVSGMLRRGSVPSADLLAKMATACGYSLRLVPQNGDETIDINGESSPPY